MYINVKLRSDDGSYSGRMYSYKTDLKLYVGDVVVAKTYKGPVDALVVEVDVPEDKIDPRILPKLKEITELYEPEMVEDSE